jgi:hypothetical protein
MYFRKLGASTDAGVQGPPVFLGFRSPHAAKAAEIWAIRTKVREACGHVLGSHFGRTVDRDLG